MLFVPKRHKFKKYHRPKPIRRIHKKTSYPILSTGVLGLKILSFGFITSNQFKTASQLINKVIKRLGIAQFFAFPNASVTVTAKASRMGKRKGAIDHWVYKVQPGFILCEINTPNLNIGIKALKSVQFRLPVPTKIILSTFK